jgi:hypothetical protein
MVWRMPETFPTSPEAIFRVYPTISTDPGHNSDLIPGDDQELFVVHQQAARLGSVCRVFAPVYRQVTLTSLVAGTTTAADRAMAFADVLDAWKHYIANDNGGRGVLLYRALAGRERPHRAHQERDRSQSRSPRATGLRHAAGAEPGPRPLPVQTRRSTACSHDRSAR